MEKLAAAKARDEAAKKDAEREAELKRREEGRKSQIAAAELKSRQELAALQAIREEQQKKIDEKVALAVDHHPRFSITLLTCAQARLLKQIENDKLERALRAGKLPSQPAAPVAKACDADPQAASSPQCSASGGSIARLCFRLPDGAALREKFDANQTYCPNCLNQPQCRRALSELATSSLGWTLVLLRGEFAPASQPLMSCYNASPSCFSRQYVLVRHLPATRYDRSDCSTLQDAGWFCAYFSCQCAGC
jgi:hypothetical protein